MIVSQFLKSLLIFDFISVCPKGFKALQSTVCGTLFQKLFGLYISGFFSIFSTKCNCSQTFKNKSTFAPLSDSLPLPINFPKVSICRLSPLSFTSAKIGKEPSSEKPKASKTLKLVYILICTKVKGKKSIDLSFWIIKGEFLIYVHSPKKF